MGLREIFFSAKDNHWITNAELVQALREIGADQCKTLFIHTDLGAIGTVNPGLKRSELLKAVYEVLLELKVDTLVFPAFTFSFANQEAFDVSKSTAKYMGALNEYVRKQPGAVRSLDPMMSVIAVGKEAESFYSVGNRCMSDGGIFSKLHQMEDVRFLFLGAKPTYCFTYAHYVEAAYGAPYRFEKWFEGQVTDRDGNTYTDRFSLFAACQGFYPGPMIPFEKQMLKNGWYQQKTVGNANLICFREEDAYQAVWDALEDDLFGFSAGPLTLNDLKHRMKPPVGRVVMVP